MNNNKYRLIKSGSDARIFSRHPLSTKQFSMSVKKTSHLVQDQTRFRSASQLGKTSPVLFNIQQTVESSNKLDDLLKRCSQIRACSNIEAKPSFNANIKIVEQQKPLNNFPSLSTHTNNKYKIAKTKINKFKLVNRNNNQVQNCKPSSTSLFRINRLKQRKLSPKKLPVLQSMFKINRFSMIKKNNGLSPSKNRSLFKVNKNGKKLQRVFSNSGINASSLKSNLTDRYKLINNKINQRNRESIQNLTNFQTKPNVPSSFKSLIVARLSLFSSIGFLFSEIIKF